MAGSSIDFMFKPLNRSRDNPSKILVRRNPVAGAGWMITIKKEETG